jgi:FkbM family methyltransferase
MTPLRRLARAFGYDLTRRRKAKVPQAQLVAVLERFAVSCVLDVGANVGQYAAGLREWGYRGRIVSFEPLAGAHAALVKRAAGDAAWQVAPRMALGASEGDIEIELSAEGDMSSILPQNALLRQVSPSSRVLGRERVPIRRLDAVAGDHLRSSDVLFLKIDTQGYEPEVLEGAKALLPRLTGVQLELALVPIYEGERDYRWMIDLMDGLGFEAYLFLPGYFERKLARQLQIDGVFMRATPKETGASSPTKPIRRRGGAPINCR